MQYPDKMKIDFEKGGGLVPAIVQDARNKNVLMMGYMNAAALEQTRTTGKVTFFSRSKGRLWTKGESSGNFLLLQSLQVDCDGDTLLIQAIPEGPSCHLGTETCWGDPGASGFIGQLAHVVADRKANPKSGSYTNKLMEAGINKVAQKVGEEAVELVIEAKDDNRELFIGEAADLLYHFLVLLASKDVQLEEVEALLKSRHR